MRRVFVLTLASLLAGCLSDDAFVDKYVETECELLMGCYSEPVRNFLGWDTVEDCIADEGQDLVNEADGCTFDRKAARACIQAMKDVTACPEEGAAFEPPAICDDVYVDCPAPDTADTADTAAGAAR